MGFIYRDKFLGNTMLAAKVVDGSEVCMGAGPCRRARTVVLGGAEGL